MSHDVPKKAPSQSANDAHRAMRFLALKAAIFILVPLVAAVLAVLVLLK